MTLKREDPISLLVEAMAIGPDAAVRAQEARGQRAFVVSDVLPKECLYCERSQLEAMGIIFGEDYDDLFVEVQLPEGWSKAPTDHPMWSKLVDDRGRERASIFYKVDR